MEIKTFSGNFREIGRQQGEIYSKNKASFKNVKIDTKLYRSQLKVYEKYYPELLEEFEGIAEAGNFDKDKLIYSFICGEILYYRSRFNTGKACTIFGVKSKKGVFVGRNYDWIPVAEKFFEVYKYENKDRNSYLALSDMGLVSEKDKKNLFYDAIDAINNRGLFIGLTFAHNNKWGNGLSSMHMIKLVSEKCSTVDQAVKLFEKVPLCCPKNFFIADKSGKMVVVEHNSKKFKLVYPKDNILIQTNHYIDSELEAEDTVLKEVPYHNTFIRYYETLQKINFKKENFDFVDCIRVLGTKGSYTCQNFPGVKTIWTLSLDMKNQKYKLYWDLFGKRKEKTLKI